MCMNVCVCEIGALFMHSGSVKTCQFWLIKGAHSGALPSRVGPANVCSNSTVNLKLFTPESQLA